MINPIRHLELLALARLAQDVPLLVISFEAKEDAQALVDLQLTADDKILPASVSSEEGTWYKVTVDMSKILEFVKDSEEIKMSHKTITRKLSTSSVETPRG